MRTLAFASLLGLSAWTAFGQAAPQAPDQAPPGVEEALRARVTKFYDAFIAGKFKEAYLLVAEDSQDKFFELSKDQYRGCQIIKVAFSENFTKATVITSCKSDWQWHGVNTVTSFPLTSTWGLIDGQWYWHFVKPSVVPSPFSPTGYVNVPPDSTTDNAGLVPKDMAAAARGILSKVGLDKTSVRLMTNQLSQEVIHLRNDMPGEVTVKVDPFNLPGLKVSLGETQVRAHGQTTLLFEWSPDDPAIKCRDCAMKLNTKLTIHVRLEPTNQVFAINTELYSGLTAGDPFATPFSPPQK
jgi:hypothetical protein